MHRAATCAIALAASPLGGAACSSPTPAGADASLDAASDAGDGLAQSDRAVDTEPAMIPDPADAGDPSTCAFTEVRSRVFASCASAGCHTSTGPAAQLSLDPQHAYASLVGVSSSTIPGELRVRAGDPDHSFLWRKLANRLDPTGHEGSPMPLDEGLTSWLRLQPEPLRIVYCWILNGAREN